MKIFEQGTPPTTAEKKKRKIRKEQKKRIDRSDDSRTKTPSFEKILENIEKILTRQLSL